MTLLVAPERVEAMEFVRQMGGDTEEQLEFADFAVGFPDEATITDIYCAFQYAKYGPEQVSMDTQSKEFYDA